MHEKISEQRNDFCVQMASYFANKYDVIVIEDLDMQAMARSLNLGKSVNDLGWGTFKRWLAFECQNHNTELIIADKYFASSKTCNHCGYKNGLLTLSDRSWVCLECGCVHDRDRNAAFNLRDYYIKNNTAGTAGINACGDLTSTARGESLVASQVVEARSPSL